MSSCFSIYDYLELYDGSDTFEFWEKDSRGDFVKDSKGKYIPDSTSASEFARKLREEHPDLNIKASYNKVWVKLATSEVTA